MGHPQPRRHLFTTNERLAAGGLRLGIGAALLLLLASGSHSLASGTAPTWPR